jgi:hypothetical protein
MLLKRKYLFGTTILAGVIAATAAPAFAQSRLPGVTVQGESKPRTPLSSKKSSSPVRASAATRPTAPTPLIQVTQRAAARRPVKSTVIDYLATIPALSNSLVPSDTTGSGLNDRRPVAGRTCVRWVRPAAP